MTARRSRTLRWLTAAAIGLLIASAVLAFIGWQRLFREIPQQLADDSMEEYFKYGSIGTEDAEGLPYDIWMVLPRLFPEYLPEDSQGVHRPGGYAAFGMAWEQGRETPVGFSRKTIGFPRVAINCALCHSTTFRTAPDEVPQVVTGGPAQRFNALAYLNFLSSCGQDPRFTADHLLREIDYSVRLDPIDRLLYRWVIIPRTRKALIQQSLRYAWTRHHNRPEWGPGRIDPFNPVKFHQLALPDDGTIGNSDMMPIWNLQSRIGQPLHWDGLNSDLTEVVLTGAIGDGATNDSLPVNKLKQLEAWLLQHQPPGYPFPELQDQSQITAGQKLFAAHCAACHGDQGARTGTVIPLNEIGTDPHRARMWTQAAVDRYHAFSDGYPWDFRHFTDQDGYVAVPLTGLWLRAPYLHNGSVPNLEALLETADRRPVTFHRGSDLYDRTMTGFVSTGSAVADEFLFDTRMPGNGNDGHTGGNFGTELTADQKQALIAFLRTL